MSEIDLIFNKIDEAGIICTNAYGVNCTIRETEFAEQLRHLTTGSLKKVLDFLNNDTGYLKDLTLNDFASALRVAKLLKFEPYVCVENNDVYVVLSINRYLVYSDGYFGIKYTPHGNTYYCRSPFECKIYVGSGKDKQYKMYQSIISTFENLTVANNLLENYPRVIDDFVFGILDRRGIKQETYLSDVYKPLKPATIHNVISKNMYQISKSKTRIYTRFFFSENLKTIYINVPGPTGYYVWYEYTMPVGPVMHAEFADWSERLMDEQAYHKSCLLPALVFLLHHFDIVLNNSLAFSLQGSDCATLPQANIPAKEVTSLDDLSSLR